MRFEKAGQYALPPQLFILARMALLLRHYLRFGGRLGNVPIQITYLLQGIAQRFSAAECATVARPVFRNHFLCFT